MKKTGIRQQVGVNQKTALRRVILLTSSVVTILSLCLILFINLSDSRNAYAAPQLGDYRTTGSGNWNNASTWERFDGSSWISAGSAPTTAENIITILNGHTITVSSNTTVDQVVVEYGGFLVVNSGIILTVANASGTDLDVFGTVKNAGIITQNGGSIVFESSGKYQHNYTITPGSIPSSTWNYGSTCEVIGYTTNPEAPGGLQAFSNFIWNCPQQSDIINLNAGITSISGDFIVMSTGTGELSLANSAVNLTIGGNMVLNGGNFVFNKSASSTILTVNGDYVQSGGVATMSDADNSTSTLNVNGTYILTDGNANYVKGNSANCSVYLATDMTITGGMITAPSVQTSFTKFVFKKPGKQYYTASGYAVSGNVDYAVNAGSTLDLGNSIVQGRNFTLSAYAGIVIGSPEGITQTGQLGNVQVTGTRSFSSSADYEYAGSTGQYTGTGLPTTIRNFVVTNSGNVTLSRTVSITGIVLFTSGSINTGSNELFVKNTSTSAISGYSSSNYVIGKLRRAVDASGSYDFPVGTPTNYEFISANLSSVTGFTDITVTYMENDPLASTTLNNVTVKGVKMTDMLRTGYWNLKPDARLTGGTFSLSVTQSGQANVNNGATFSLLNRQSSLMGWASEGTHNSNTQFVNSGAVSAARSSLNVFGDFAIGYGDYLVLQSPTLISGVAGQQNAVYLFPEVCSNVDAWVQVSEISGGASIVDIDDQTTGYNESWQPVIQANANSTGQVKWNVQLKVAGTSNDTIIPQLALTAINVDGMQNVKEFVNANAPYSYATTSTSNLTVSNENGWYKATSAYTTSAVDTADHETMFQVTYQNIRSFQLVTGIKNTSSSKVKRQSSIYFRNFLKGSSGLPVKMLYFTAALEDREVKLKWATSSEDNNDYFTIERSSDGENFTAIKTQKGAGTSNSVIYYTDNDADPFSGTSFYRIRQTNISGRFSFSEVQTIVNSGMQSSNSIEILAVNPNPFTEFFTIDFRSTRSQSVSISIVNSSGKQMYRSQINASKGTNNFKMPSLSYLNKGVYILVLSDESGQVSKRVIKG